MFGRISKSFTPVSSYLPTCMLVGDWQVCVCMCLCVFLCVPLAFCVFACLSLCVLAVILMPTTA